MHEKRCGRFVPVMLATTGVTTLVSGCAGAPSLPIAGAYFPAWLACALVGIAGAIAARMGMVATGLAEVLPFQLLVCGSLGVVCGALAWVAWIGL